LLYLSAVLGPCTYNHQLAAETGMNLCAAPLTEYLREVLKAAGTL